MDRYWDMTHTFEGTTLALQHYYDIVARSRKLPLLTVYRAQEQPFSHSMLVWMAGYGDGDFQVSEATRQRLDEALLKNRGIEDAHVLRVLDYGTSEGRSFVVTDATDAVTLRAWLRAHGPVEPWQALRLLSQVASVVHAAHRSGFYHLCMTSQQIFVTDTARFEIMASPLGMGLTRAEILALRNVPVTADLVRHIPPWAYACAPQGAFGSQSGQAGVAHGEALEGEIQALDASEGEIQALDASEGEIQALDASEGEIQALDASEVIVSELPGADVWQTPAGLCDDVYNAAALVYEALTGRHPYFSDDADSGNAAMGLTLSSPLPPSDRVEVSECVSQVVMSYLGNAREGGMASFLNEFAAACAPQEREKAREAQNPWVEIAPGKSVVRKRRALHSGIERRFKITVGIFLAAVCAVVFVTWHVARYREPVDLFAIPEIIPAVPNGVDVVIQPRLPSSEATLYLVSLSDGALIRLGKLPFIYRSQKAGSRLQFVIADDAGHSMQVPVVVNSPDSLMVVTVDLPW